jgi:hypothetical protein
LSRRHRATTVLLLLVLTLSGCSGRGGAGPVPGAGGGPATTGPGSGTTAPARGGAQGPRVVVVVEENRSFPQVIGSPAAPFLNRLARQGVLLGAYHAITHPSLPNYIAMVSGDTHGINSNCTSCAVGAPSLAGQLERAGVSWKAYMQGLPVPCSDVPQAGAYAKKHDPFMYFDEVRRSPALCGRVVPFSQLAADLAGGGLPRFAFVVPDLEHDMHNWPVGVADQWLRDLHDQLAASPSWRPDTRLVVTFDEGTDPENRVATVISGPRLRPGRDDTAYSHYSLLRSIETLFGLPLLGHADDAATATIPALAGR